MLQTLAAAALLGAAGPLPAETPSATSPRPAPAADKETIVVRSSVPAERAGPFVEARTYRLRNIAAADFARPLAGRLLSIDRSAEVVSQPESNALLVFTTAAGHACAAELMTALDRDVPSVHIGVTVAKVPAGFLADCGLARPGKADSAWVLTEREAALFHAALRHYPTREVLSRPQVVVRDNQTGFVQVGQEVPAGPELPAATTGVSARLTPRLAPDGKAVLLRVAGQTTTAAPGLGVQANGATIPGLTRQAVEATVSVPAGGTAVVAVPTAGDDGKPAAVLFVLTPTPRP